MSFRTGGFITAGLALVVMPWKIYSTPVIINDFLGTLGAFLGPLFGIMMVDFYLRRRQVVVTEDLYRLEPGGSYYYKRGVNPFSWMTGAALGAGIYAAVTAGQPAPVSTPRRRPLLIPWTHGPPLALRLDPTVVGDDTAGDVRESPAADGYTMSLRQGKGTSTSNFGVGGRESHNASAFYARFQPKELSTAETLAPLFELDTPLVCGDARSMDLPDNSVALVVTSPPYFAGKEYEEALGQGVIPATYAEYLQLLSDVFAECLRVLEPGGRLAVNVANLGRKPYRSLSADVVRILDDDLGMLLRGEIIWKKAEGAAGSCAWGSYRSPTNPVLRDVSERVVVASKGRFDRAVNLDERRLQGRPHVPSISTDEFMEATLDVWDIRPESARRVHHPAPFPVELPQRLMELYTFKDDLVLDPFLGSGTTAVAAVRTGRHYVGYDTDPSYVELAQIRVEEEHLARAATEAKDPEISLPLPTLSGNGDVKSRSTVDGKAAQPLALDILDAAGFEIAQRDHKIPGLGLRVNVVAKDRDGENWYFDVTGAFTTTRGGLLRTDTLWKCLGRASVLATRRVRPVVLLSSHLPPRRSSGDRALRAIGPAGVHDVMDMLNVDDRQRLAEYASGGHRCLPLTGFWTPTELEAPHWGVGEPGR